MLMPFVPFMKLNPRSIKRLLNGCGIWRDMDLAKNIGDVIDRKKLALWIILLFEGDIYPNI
jgi:hypothetical protein